MKLSHRKCAFEDKRGRITDILEKAPIEYVTLITSKKGAVRGNHYHKKSIQYTFVLKGSLHLVTQKPKGKIKKEIIKTGDLAFTDMMESHALKAIENSQLLIMTRGPRGGGDYEKDTYRLEDKLIK